MMDAEQWPRVKSIFLKALEQAPDERSVFLEEACAGDEGLRRSVERLLASDGQADAFLETPVLAASGTLRPDAPQVGQRLGAYRLTALIGQGGMGAVYRAERADGQFTQQVAIKVVRHGRGTDEIVRRFQYERQILAHLQHPHIARLLDGSVTEAGAPYLVMEYVDGQPITAYCDQRALSVDERIDLFETVCSAVQYAHQNLVIHRDLKPSNILVTEEGSVKLLDFGIAKLLDAEQFRTGQPLPMTRVGMQVLTPEYASPEQIRGEAITTATDVYQLGVLLYELLTGIRPYSGQGRSLSELERVICEETPPKPSVARTRLGGGDREAGAEGAQTRGLPLPNRLRSRLSGDLDTMVLMALRKEPERRYASVRELADDLRRYQEGRPVRARPDTLGYRMSKFTRRHRAGVMAAGLILLSLIGGLAATVWQARIAERERQRAEQRFADVRHLANAFLFEFHDAIADLPGSTAARELIVQRALEYLDKLAREEGIDRGLRLELATAYRKVGDVQGNPTNANLGRSQDALVSYQKGLDLARSVLRQDSTDVEARRVLANINEKLGDVQAATGELAQAEAHKRRAVRFYRTLAHDHPDADARQLSYAVALIKLGDLQGNPNFPNRGNRSAALTAYTEARGVLEQLHAANPEHPETNRLRGVIFERLGTIYDEEGHRAEALQAYRQSLSIREHYAAAHPANTDAIRDLAIAHEKMGDMLVQAGQLTEAQARYEQSRAIFAELAAADPQNAQAQQTLAISHIHLGDVAGGRGHPNLGDRSAARDHYQDALTLMQAVQRIDSTNARAQSLLELVQQHLADMGKGATAMR